MSTFYIFHCSSLVTSKGGPVNGYSYTGRDWIHGWVTVSELNVSPLCNGDRYVWLDNAHILCWLSDAGVSPSFAANLALALPQEIHQLRERWLKNFEGLEEVCRTLGYRDAEAVYNSLPAQGKHLSKEEVIYDNFRNFLPVR